MSCSLSSSSENWAIADIVRSLRAVSQSPPMYEIVRQLRDQVPQKGRYCVLGLGLGLGLGFGSDFPLNG